MKKQVEYTQVSGNGKLLLYGNSKEDDDIV